MLYSYLYNKIENVRGVIEKYYCGLIGNILFFFSLLFGDFFAISIFFNRISVRSHFLFFLMTQCRPHLSQQKDADCCGKWICLVVCQLCYQSLKVDDSVWCVRFFPIFFLSKYTYYNHDPFIRGRNSVCVRLCTRFSYFPFIKHTHALKRWPPA